MIDHQGGDLRRDKSASPLATGVDNGRDIL